MRRARASARHQVTCQSTRHIIALACRSWIVIIEYGVISSGSEDNSTDMVD